MTAKIDQETTDSVTSCAFAKKCLECFNDALCCTVIEKRTNFLIVEPVSLFKSNNCTFKNIVKINDEDVHICTCSVRAKMYKNQKK